MVSRGDAPFAGEHLFSCLLSPRKWIFRSFLPRELGQFLSCCVLGVAEQPTETCGMSQKKRSGSSKKPALGKSASGKASEKSKGKSLAKKVVARPALAASGAGKSKSGSKKPS